MDKIIYLDHAATTPVDESVLREMIPCFTNNFGNPSSVYSIGKYNKKNIDKARKQVADSIGAKPEEIYFTSCGSESDNLAIKGIAKGNKSRGRHIITSKIEHPAVLETCKTLEKEGFNISYINVDENGLIKLDELKRAIRRDTILISIMYANNEIGTIQPIEEIGRIAKQNRIYFHTDCVQAVGNIEIDVRKQNIDSLSMSAHKFYGPKGVGALYIRDGIPFVRQQDGGHQEKDKRAGTENVAGIVGIGKAIEISNRNLFEYNKHLKTLRDIYVRTVLKRFKYVHVNGDIEKRLPGNMNISFLGIKGAALVEELDKRGICCSSGSACSSGIIQPSRVIMATGANKQIAESALRVTFGRENSVDDVKYLIESLDDILKKYRN
ncbi:MAG: cysteine desulfurase [Clostridia bacterium]|nr:cysteine desulfurase [Clostridia bacterium]